jgi:hypothetical protein
MTARTDLMAQNEPTPDIVEVFWNARPCNWHSPKPVGTREYFDEVEQRKHFVEPHIPEFAQFDYWAGKRVLEVGCGIGTARRISRIPNRGTCTTPAYSRQSGY